MGCLGSVKIYAVLQTIAVAKADVVEDVRFAIRTSSTTSFFFKTDVLEDVRFANSDVLEDVRFVFAKRTRSSAA